MKRNTLFWFFVGFVGLAVFLVTAAPKSENVIYEKISRIGDLQSGGAGERFL